MNVRLKKEFTALFWPWLVAAVIGLIPLLSWMLPASLLDQTFSSVYVLAYTGFVIGTVLLATLPFGEEFSQRTMSILLSHPVTRWQIWTEKLRITLYLTISIAMLNIISCLPFWELIGSQLKVALAFLIFTVSSGAFWVLLARSTIGGTVLCLFTQAAIVVTAYAVTQERYFDIGIWDHSKDTESILLKISLFISPVFLWLGWKLFSRLQDTGSTSIEIPFLTAPHTTASSTWFRARPASPGVNLIFKELSHYRPLLLMAYLFSALWIGMLLLGTFFPLKHTLLTETLNGFLAIYAAMVLVTSGCISLGEEKEMGLHASNLTLPVAWKRQWLLKISLAFIIGLSGAVLLPLLLTTFETLVAIRPMKTLAYAFLKETDMPAMSMLILMLSSFVAVGFWAATVTNRTIHAAFLAGFTIMLVAVFHTTGKSMKQGAGYHTATILDWITAHLHLHLGWAAHYYGEFFYLSFAVIGLLFLPFSRFYYQNQASTKSHIVKTSILIVALSWISGFTLTDLQRSASDQHAETHPFSTELRAALLALKADTWHTNYPPHMSVSYGPKSLKSSGKLSPLTAKWMEAFVISVQQHSYTNENGQTFRFIYANLEKPVSHQHLSARPIFWTNATPKAFSAPNK